MSIYRSFARPNIRWITRRPCGSPNSLSPRSLRGLSTDATPTPAVPRTRRIPFRYVWYLISLSVGVAAGGYLQGYATARLLPPSPGSEEDAAALEALGDEMDELEIVKTMRAHALNTASGKITEGTGKWEAGWVELDVQDNIAQVAKDGYRTRPLTQLAMAGIQGLGIQRAFWNSETRELVAVIWVGPRLSGWPGIAHGGAIATIFEEIMSRMIAGPSVSIDTIPSPASMSVTYARPTPSFNTYILRTSFSAPDIPQDEPPKEKAPAKTWLPFWKDFTKQSTSVEPERPLEISGTLESLDGEVKVRAKGTWPASALARNNA